MLAFVGLQWPAAADSVRNGNELALNLTRLNDEKRADLVKTRLNMIHTFRFLKIKEKSEPDPETGAIKLKTVEPSSDAIVSFTISRGANVSYGIVQPLTTNDAIAINGRVEKISKGRPPVIEMGQTVVQFKDKLTPKIGLELRTEVDPTAADSSKSK
ncbi:MAG: hypothetical protein NTY53_18495 [Kiritimatiellaeota bacterium]|nr:hypothetical protein [Kiritimatiellota bacterium]